MAVRILPRPDYVYKPRRPVQIIANPDYKPPNLHTRAQFPDALRNRIEAEWCPICHSRDIGERMQAGRVLWLCRTCDYKW